MDRLWRAVVPALPPKASDRRFDRAVLTALAVPRAHSRPGWLATTAPTPWRALEPDVLARAFARTRSGRWGRPNARARDFRGSIDHAAPVRLPQGGNGGIELLALTFEVIDLCDDLIEV